jgi:hypothetical protein
LRIHRGNQVVSGEDWRLFKEAYPERDFSNFWLEASLNFSIVALICPGFFFNMTATLLLLRLRALEFCEDRAPYPQDWRLRFLLC